MKTTVNKINVPSEWHEIDSISHHDLKNVWKIQGNINIKQEWFYGYFWWFYEIRY